MSCDACVKLDGAREIQNPFCEKCGGLMPLPKNLSPFALLGVPEVFSVDVAALTSRHLALSQKLHPDRFVRAPQSERMRSLAWTTALNDAFRLLKSREDRATYLLKARGIDLGSESGHAAQMRISAAFLEETLEEREALFEAQAEDDHEAAEALAQKVRARMNRHQIQLAQAFERLEDAEKKGRADETAQPLEDAAQALAHLKYDARFLEEADRFEMAGLE